MPHVQHEPVEESALPSYSGIQVIRSSVISTHASKLTSAEKQRARWGAEGFPTDNQMLWPGGDTQCLYSQQQTNHMGYPPAKESSSAASICLRGEGA